MALLAMANLVACTPSGADRPVVELAATEAVDPDVVALVRRHAAGARLQPGDARLRATLALAYEANELWEEGTRAWADALFLDPAQPVWRYHEAICLHHLGDAAASISALRRAVAEAPDFAAARHRLGERLLDAEDLEGARGEFEASIRLVDFAPDPYIGLAEVMLRKGDHARTVQLCERALALDPDSRRAHYALGLAYRGLGRQDEAQAELGKGLESGRRYLSDPLTSQLESFREGFSVRFAEAARMKKEGHLQGAVPILESLLKRRPDDVNVLNNLAGCYIELQRFEAARPLLVKAAEIDPAQFATYLNLAEVEVRTKRFAEALANADKAVELAPKLGRSHSMRASVLLETGRIEEAFVEFETAVELDPTSGFDFGRLGSLALGLGRLREAVEHYETAARLLPDSLPAQAGLAKAYFRAGEKPKALAAFERARKLAPKSAQVQALGVELGAAVQ
ncbi:MAG: tetratricopeptide repeat protein [Planctomycetota bacterium]